MSEPFIAEIRIFAGNFAPRSWAFCDGQLLGIAQNTALFSIVGTTYGGDGRSTFGLPNLKGRAPMHPGNGPGLSTKRLGESGGSPTVTLAAANLPPHSHALNGLDVDATTDAPADRFPAKTKEDNYGSGGAIKPMADGIVSSTLGGQSHNNMQPYLAMYFIIALQGLYPSRS